MPDIGEKITQTVLTHNTFAPIQRSESKEKGEVTKIALMMVLRTEDKGFVTVVQKRKNGLNDFFVCGTVNDEDNLSTDVWDGNSFQLYGLETLARETDEEVGKGVSEVLTLFVKKFDQMLPPIDIWNHKNITSNEQERFITYRLMGDFKGTSTELSTLLTQMADNLEIIPINDLYKEESIQKMMKRLWEYIVMISQGDSRNLNRLTVRHEI